jgi:carbon-monoxide dehydrogenase large subunit
MESRETRLISGRGQFIDDLDLANMAHLVFLGSPYAHARIVNVDTSKALQIKGVLTVITGREILEWTKPLPPQFVLQSPGWTFRIPEVYALAVDKARWFGEPVAAVVAEDEAAALEAAELVDVEYEPLPVITDPVEAMKPDAPRIYGDWPDNIQSHVKFDFGDVDAAFEEADRILNVSYREGRASGFPLEARGFIADYHDGLKGLTVWGTFQCPFVARHIIAETLRLPEVKVRAIATDIGGSFGNKIHTWKEIIVALASIITRRPVKWTESQREWFATGPHQRDVFWEGQVAVKNDGRVLGIKAKVVKDLGAEGSNKGLGAMGVIAACCNVANAYRWRGMRMEGLGVVTNKSFYCAYRGYAKDKGIKFIEYVMDQIARELSLKPEDIRFKNFIQPDEFPYRQINNYTYDSGNYPAVLKKALEIANVDAWRDKQKDLLGKGKYLGVGVVFTVEAAGIGGMNTTMSGLTEARVKINPDGTVEVFSDRTEIGQGAEQSHAIIVSEILGCNIEEIVVHPVTSDMIGIGPPSSRGAVYSASAVAKAAKLLKKKVLQYASVFLKEDAGNIEMRDGNICSLNDPEKRLTYKELASRAYFFPGPRALPKEFLLNHNLLLDVSTEWYCSNTAETGSTYVTFCASADIAVVEVDVETGTTQILKYAHVHDSGKAISREILDGQIHGGVVQGIGEALSEKLIYDERGQLLSSSYSDYLIPTALDSPDIVVGHLETPSPFTETGSKGMGESPTIGSKAAVLAAIGDALSSFRVQVNDSPATRERVRRWILQSQKSGSSKME